MNTRSFVSRVGVPSATLLFFALTPQAGCSDCDDYGTCDEPTGGGAGTSGMGGESGQGGQGGQGGEGGGPPAGCIPSEVDGVVEDSCGVFVSSSLGTAGAEGTKAAPVATIAEALSIANGKPIYLCGESFDEAVDMDAGTDVFGALACADGWAYASGTKSQINGPENVIAWKVSGSGTSILADLAVAAASATDPGASSIAMLIDGSTVDLLRCDLTAGDGAAGAPPPADPDDPTLDGDPATNGSNQDALMQMACVAATDINGGAPGEKTCGAVNVDGGSGGDGQNIANGGNGAPGNGPGGSGTGGPGGNGEGLPTPCSGTEGDQGGPGTPGDGATGLGSISSTGYAGTPGGAGVSAGGHGEGGGGGGGANECGTGLAFAGPSGGGGGSGGCGGAPGVGGAAGGSSIALVSLDATVTLTGSVLTANLGAVGGIGSAGQEGGDGGAPGNGGMGGGACAGGQGGHGGRGGAGGGGLGGHSLGIAFTGAEPMRDGGSITVGEAGLGAEGGDGGPSNLGGTGENGQALETLSFD
jgi:hypothetical protein